MISLQTNLPKTHGPNRYYALVRRSGPLFSRMKDARESACLCCVGVRASCREHQPHLRKRPQLPKNDRANLEQLFGRYGPISPRSISRSVSAALNGPHSSILTANESRLRWRRQSCLPKCSIRNSARLPRACNRQAGVIRSCCVEHLRRACRLPMRRVWSARRIFPPSRSGKSPAPISARRRRTAHGLILAWPTSGAQRATDSVLAAAWKAVALKEVTGDTQQTQRMDTGMRLESSLERPFSPGSRPAREKLYLELLREFHA